MESTQEGIRLAGGFGAPAAVQSPEMQLRRVVMANILWEDQAYEKGTVAAKAIRDLVPMVAPETVAQIAREARIDQGLRHVPLFIAIQMLKHETHRPLVASLLVDIVGRADSITTALQLYWKENPAPDGKRHAPLASQLKVGLRRSFDNFDTYQLSKYQEKRGQVPMQAAVRLLRPRPTQSNAQFFRELKAGKVTPPDTWEVALSKGEDKAATFTRLIQERKLGGIAFLRNLNLMEKHKVPAQVIALGFETLPFRWALPIDFIEAAKQAPNWKKNIEAAMLRALRVQNKLPGFTLLIVDVSGSMREPISAHSAKRRIDAAAALAVIAKEMCEECVVYATAGSDYHYKHSTLRLPDKRGFDLSQMVLDCSDRYTTLYQGGGGIFTRQVLDFTRQDLKGRVPDRIAIFSDSQDTDQDKTEPKPFGNTNYIIDVSAHKHGINYAGIWTAEIAGWSPRFLDFIAAAERVPVSGQVDENDD